MDVDLNIVVLSQSPGTTTPGGGFHRGRLVLTTRCNHHPENLHQGPVDAVVGRLAPYHAAPRTAGADARSARRLDPPRVAGQDLSEAGGPEALPGKGLCPAAGAAGRAGGGHHDSHLLGQPGPLVDQTRELGLPGVTTRA